MATSLLANYEIIGAIFLLVMIYFTFVAYKRKQISKNVVVEIFKSRNWEDVESFYEEIMKY